MDDKEKDLLLDKILSRIHRASLKIPALEGYELTKSDYDGVILAAEAKDHSMLLFIEDKKLGERETFENRLEEIKLETQKASQEKGCQEAELIFIEDFKGKVLNFKLYLFNNVIGDIQIRQINAYFLEPESKYVYLITLLTPPLKKEYVSENVTKNLLNKIKPVLYNVEYNDQKPF